jgi:hypothetical protein
VVSGLRVELVDEHLRVDRSNGVAGLPVVGFRDDLALEHDPRGEEHLQLVRHPLTQLGQLGVERDCTVHVERDTVALDLGAEVLGVCSSSSARGHLSIGLSGSGTACL